MTPTYTNKPHNDESNGNCLRASLASVFEVEIDSMPFFEDMARDEWRPAVRKWIESQGFYVSQLQEDPKLDDFYLAIGISAKIPLRHCVVYKAGELAHDPLKNGGGLAETHVFWHFTPMT